MSGKSVVSTNIDELLTLLKEVKDILSINRENAVGTMNLFDVCGRAHYENQHSNILAYLLDEQAGHKHEEFSALFLEMINEKLPEKPLPSEHIRVVKRERTIDASRRIDLFLEADSFAVVLENKIHAADQAGQLFDYYQWAKANHRTKRIILCYLTLDGSDPSKESIPMSTLNTLKKNSNYVSLAYSSDILSWLGSLEVKDEEHVLKAALVQYIDVIEGLCEFREEDCMDRKSVIDSMSDICGNLDSYALQEVLQNTRLIEQGCKFYIFTNFLQELVKGVEDKGGETNPSPAIYYTHKQNRYKPSDIEEWKRTCMEDFNDIGIELELDESAGIGFELESLLTKPKMYFGVMLHGKKRDTSFDLFDDWRGEGYEILKDESGFWGIYTETSWIVNYLFDAKREALDIGKISKWFVFEWEENRKFINKS